MNDNQTDCEEDYCVNGQEVVPQAREPFGGWPLGGKCLGSAKLETPVTRAVRGIVTQLDTEMSKNGGAS